jgi:transglutaminase-like putative cysteine protease
MKIAITHVTRLEFSDEVRETVMDAHLGPRDDVDQRVTRFSMRLEPAGRVRRYEDGFGNTAHLLTNMRPHTYLQVSADSEVSTYMADPFQLAPRPPRALDVIELADCLDPSPLVPHLPVLEEMAAPFRSDDDDGVFASIQRMSELIHRDFTYQSGVTDVTTSIEQIVEGRQGVCQDFAHLLLGMCRSIGIPARYASGYIAARRQTADANAPSRGVGASHAWVEAFTSTHGWRGFDPTNNLVANEYYVKIAIGRDYSDVPPTRGTYHGGPSESLSVAVTARPID